MTRENYFHRALFVPFVLLLAAAGLLFVVRPDSSLLVVLVAFHSIIAVPCLLIAVILRWWTRAWSGPRLARSSVAVPPILALVAGLTLATTGLDWEPSTAPVNGSVWAEDAFGWFMAGFDPAPIA